MIFREQKSKNRTVFGKTNINRQINILSLIF